MNDGENQFVEHDISAPTTDDLDGETTTYSDSTPPPKKSHCPTIVWISQRRVEDLRSPTPTPFPAPREEGKTRSDHPIARGDLEGEKALESLVQELIWCKDLRSLDGRLSRVEPIHNPNSRRFSTSTRLSKRRDGHQKAPLSVERLPEIRENRELGESCRSDRLKGQNEEVDGSLVSRVQAGFGAGKHRVIQIWSEASNIRDKLVGFMKMSQEIREVPAEGEEVEQRRSLGN